MNEKARARAEKTIKLLDKHYDAFHSVVDVARETGHPVPVDTRGWSQIIVSVLTGIKGLNRKKGPDLEDGSDVKAANTWEAIDTPRFNGVIKAGTQAAHSDSIACLDLMPFLYFVLWDKNAISQCRCRIWVVRTRVDTEFREMCENWYNDRVAGVIGSNNFQLHPPRGKDTDVFRNTYGNLSYPLLFSAVRGDQGYKVESHDPGRLDTGLCKKEAATRVRLQGEARIDAELG